MGGWPAHHLSPTMGTGWWDPSLKQARLHRQHRMGCQAQQEAGGSSGEHGRSAPGEHGNRTQRTHPRGTEGPGQGRATLRRRRGAGPRHRCCCQQGMDLGEEGPAGRSPSPRGSQASPLPGGLSHSPQATSTEQDTLVQGGRCGQNLNSALLTDRLSKVLTRSQGPWEVSRRPQRCGKAGQLWTCLPGGQRGGSKDRDLRGLLRPVGGQSHRQAPQHHLFLIHSLITKGNTSARRNSTLTHVKVTDKTGCPEKRTSPFPGRSCQKHTDWPGSGETC